MFTAAEPEFFHPGMQGPLALWEAQRDRAGSPCYENFPLASLGHSRHHIALIAVERPPLRFRIDRVGAALVRYYGADHAGNYVDKVMPPAQRQTAMLAYFACVATRAPVFDRVRYSAPKMTGTVLHRLLLPFTTVDGEVDTILAAVYADQRLH